MRTRSVIRKNGNKVLHEATNSHFQEVVNLNQIMTERALEMKCQAYLSGVKADLLMQTIYEFNRSRKQLKEEISKRKKSESELNETAVKLRRLNYQLELLSVIDPLTKIFNRRKFHQEVTNELIRFNRYGTPFSIIFCDLDFFKKVNDDFGHDVGDSVLKEFTKLVKKNIRQSDIFARWGGEEFIILTVESDINEAVGLAEKLRKAIEGFKFKKVGKITCSLGVAQALKSDTIETIEKRADSALYRAKKNGRNRVESD